MPDLQRLTLFVGSGVAGLALLLLIISVGTPAWLDDGKGSTVGLFRKCLATNTSDNGLGEGCHNENRTTQAGLSVFGLLLLAFGLFATIAGAFTRNPMIMLASLGLVYFASMFVMCAYSTWGQYSRVRSLYNFPSSVGGDRYTDIGYSYNLCVASHFFIWTALTLIAFGVGYHWGSERNN